MSSIARRVYELLVDRAGLNKLPFKSVPYGYVSLEFWLGAIVASAFAWLAISGILLHYTTITPTQLRLIGGSWRLIRSLELSWYRIVLQLR